MQDEGIRSFATAISPGYFATMGIRVVEGRDFGWSDNADGRRVAIVSRSLSAALRQPRIIGTRLRTGDYESLQDLEVVGVVEDATIADVRSTNQAVVYLPSLQLGEVANWKVLIVNGTASASPGIRTAVESSGRDFVSTIIALDDVFARGTARERFLTRMVTGLAGLALLLAGVGLYGLVTFEARQRRKEMAVRLALGAPRIHVVAAQLRPTAIATAIGAIAGIGLAFAVTPVLAAQLFDTTPYDVASFAVGAGSLVLVSLIASVPAVVGVLSRESQMTLRAE